MKYTATDLETIRNHIDAHPEAAGQIYNSFTDKWRVFVDTIDETNMHKDCPAAQQIMVFAKTAADLVSIFEAANQTKAADALQRFRSTIVHQYNDLPTTH